MNRNSGNVSKTKKLISGVGNNSKPNRKLFHKLSDSSSISSNRNSSAHSEEDVRVSGAYLRPQVAGNVSPEEQEQLMKKLQAQVKDLRHKLRVLEESVDSKDYSLGTIAREKDRAVGEVRRLERSNKQLRQQLHDERNHYLEEKEKFCEEMTKYKKKLQEVKSVSDGKKAAPISRHSLINQSLRRHLNREKGDFADSKTTSSDLLNSKSQKLLSSKDRTTLQMSTLSFSDSQFRKPDSVESLHLYEGDDVSLQMTALRTENAKLRSIICERDERNYELCLRFLRMKHYKNDIKNRFQDLENEYLQVIANLMDKIDEARQEFNFIIDQKFKRPLHSTNAVYLQMVQRNSRMAFENASLRLENQCLKKELNKYMNSASEFDSRKVQSQPTVEELEPKLTLEEETNDKKLKRIKKNVNFKEIRTIYERDLNFKNSDTDSNYMSKTSTTVPSNGSLGDPKSNESIIEGVHDSGSKIPSSFKVNSLPDEILNKIFKRIDTSSCQSLDSGRSKDLVKAVAKSKNETPDRTVTLGFSENHIQHKPLQPSEKNIPKEEPSGEKAQKPVIIEHKSPPKITDSSSPCESKESVHFYAKELPVYSPCGDDRGLEETEKEIYLSMRRPGKPDQPRTYKNRLSSQRRGSGYFDRELEEGSFLDVNTRRNLLGRQYKPSLSGQQGEFAEERGRFRKKQMHDNCGLQENPEISDLELPPPEAVGSKVEAEKPVKGTEERSEETMARVVLEESDEDRLGEKGRPRLGAKVLPPAIGSRSKSSNKLSLQDELLEAKRHHRKSDDSTYRAEEASRWIRSGSLTKVQKIDQENAGKSFQCNVLDPPRIPYETSQSVMERDITQSRRPEASKRFSHRLVSTSPEQLRSILTESQLGTFQMAPIIVGHATTEISPSFKYGDSNEIFLQLVIPQKTEPSAQIFLDNGDALEKDGLGKETSRSVLSPSGPGKSSNPAETCSSDIRIQVSSLPTSSSTMEMIDSAAINYRSNIMMRTLSAPGLLESNWLDPYTVCELRDCRGRVGTLDRAFPTLGQSIHSPRIRFRVHQAVCWHRRFL